MAQFVTDAKVPYTTITKKTVPHVAVKNFKHSRPTVGQQQTETSSGPS